MKIVLLVLSGNAEHARDWLLEKYPGASVDNIPREQLDSGSWSQRLNALRSLRPDIFAVATERLIWQRGQNALLLFGALGGARPVVLVDARGDSREESRGGILRAIAGSTGCRSGGEHSGDAKSQSRLKQLEQVVANRSSASPEESCSASDRLSAQHSQPGFGRRWRGDAHQWFRQCCE